MPRPPSTGIVTSPYGMRYHPISGGYRMHYGEDTVGDGNYSPVAGTVVFAGWDRTGHGFGNAVGIRENSRVVWWMAHFSSLAVTVGQSVVEGQYLGRLGATGAATGPHVHTERRVDGSNSPGSGTATNPRHYYGSTPAGDDTEPFEEKDEIMSNSTRYHYKPAAPGSPAEYGIFGEEIPATENFPGGYEVSTVEATGVAWGRLYGRPDGSPWTSNMTRDQWVRLQAESTHRHNLWLQQQIAVSSGVSADISSLPTKDDLGQALTSTVALVNEHADDNRDQIIAAIPGGSGSSSYALSIDIDSVPGTATGTATSV